LIQCKERCDKALSCGHDCREACSASTCSCRNGCKTTIAPSPEKPSQGSTQFSPSKTSNPEPHRQQPQKTFKNDDAERIQAFQKYTQGGSREHDRILVFQSQLM
jgi:hypothetical protein